MKVIQIVTLFERNGANKQTIQGLLDQIRSSIEKMEHPHGSGKFLLYNRRKGNGVKPIKDSFLNDLLKFNWLLEHRVYVGVTAKPGPIDAVFPIGRHFFAVEWETGNIASSHRAINKIVIGLLTNQLLGGVLILPSRNMYDYLTDRIGNFRELQPYFDVWRRANYDVDEGYIYVIEIEHDGLTDNPELRIRKGTDGRALR